MLRQTDLRCAVRSEILGLVCHYCGTSSRSSFVLAGLRVATLEHAICDCEGSHFVEPKERDCGAGRATGDLVNTLGGRFRYPLQCCDKVNSRALRTVDTCMCSHIPMIIVNLLQHGIRNSLYLCERLLRS